MSKADATEHFHAPAVTFGATTPSVSGGRMTPARRAELLARYPSLFEEAQATHRPADGRTMTPARRRELLSPSPRGAGNPGGGGRHKGRGAMSPIARPPLPYYVARALTVAAALMADGTAYLGVVPAGGRFGFAFADLDGRLREQAQAVWRGEATPLQPRELSGAYFALRSALAAARAAQEKGTEHDHR